MGSVTNAQTVASLGTDTIALGDQTTLTVKRALTYPSLDMLTRDGIVALSQEMDTATHTQTTVITSFEPGLHFVHLSAEDSLPLIVTDVEIDSATAELRDLAPLQKIPYTFWEIFRWVLLGLVIAAIGFGLWWFRTHRSIVQQVLSKSAPIDTRTPEERAIDTLEELRQRHLWQQGKQKEYHTELTDAVRRFIEECTDIRATDLTSDETIEEVKKGKWKVECSILRDIFTTADLVKFAKGEPQPLEHERSMTNAETFVHQLWEDVRPQKEEVKDE